MNKTTWGIILAAGKGVRMGESCNGTAKQFLEWKGRPLYWHSAMAMSLSASVHGLIFVFGQEFVERERKRIQDLAKLDNLGLAWQAVAGGQRRQDSSANGLAALPTECERVLIHDAARPFVSPELVRLVANAITEAQPCIVPGIGVTDTIKVRDQANRGFAQGTLPRSDLVAVQTPQGFWKPLLEKAIRQVQDVTDDAMLLEQFGYPTLIVDGDPANLKITTAEELYLLKEDCSQLLPCSGLGYDVHRYGTGRPLKLGGVAIPGGCEVIAHSDGDLLLHALMDSLLGMASLGDIGRHFPDSDAKYEGISSAILLDEVLGLLSRAQVKICHVDLTVVAQKPKLAPYAEEIRANVARLLGLPKISVNFKATTEEKLGFTGTCEGIKAYALASGLKNADDKCGCLFRL